MQCRIKEGNIIKHVLLLLILLASLAVWAGEADLLANLPPDPGAAGKATLAGIDSDNDGVRDDVQRWIALTYPNSQKTRAALRQYALAQQKFLLNAVDPVKTANNSSLRGNAVHCLFYIRGNDADIILSELRAVFLNTGVRSRAYLQADRHLSGTSRMLPPRNQHMCSFNPNVLPN